MATYAQAKVKTAQANAAVARARTKAPPPGVLLFTVALSLGCFLVSDYLLFRPCDADEDNVGIFQTYLWSSHDDWLYFAASRVLLSGVVFLCFCVLLACVLGCCGFRAQASHSQTGSSNC